MSESNCDVCRYSPCRCEELIQAEKFENTLSIPTHGPEIRRNVWKPASVKPEKGQDCIVRLAGRSGENVFSTYTNGEWQTKYGLAQDENVHCWCEIPEGYQEFINNGGNIDYLCKL